MTESDSIMSLGRSQMGNHEQTKRWKGESCRGWSGVKEENLRMVTQVIEGPSAQTDMRETARCMSDSICIAGGADHN